MNSIDKATEARVLLSIFHFSTNSKVSKGQLILTRTGEKVRDYDPIFEDLERKGAIERDKHEITLTSAGKDLLRSHLKDPQIAFDGTQVGSWVANALLKWIRCE